MNINWWPAAWRAALCPTFIHAQTAGSFSFVGGGLFRNTQSIRAYSPASHLCFQESPWHAIQMPR